VNSVLTWPPLKMLPALLSGNAAAVTATGTVGYCRTGVQISSQFYEKTGGNICWTS